MSRIILAVVLVVAVVGIGWAEEREGPAVVVEFASEDWVNLGVHGIPREARFGGWGQFGWLNVNDTWTYTYAVGTSVRFGGGFHGYVGPGGVVEDGGSWLAGYWTFGAMYSTRSGGLVVSLGRNTEAGWTAGFGGRI